MSIHLGQSFKQTPKDALELMEIFFKDPTVINDILKKNFLHSDTFEEIPKETLEKVDQLVKHILKEYEKLDGEEILKKEILKILENSVQKDDFTPLISFLSLLRKRVQILQSIQDIQKEQSIITTVSFIFFILESKR